MGYGCSLRLWADNLNQDSGGTLAFERGRRPSILMRRDVSILGAGEDNRSPLFHLEHLLLFKILIHAPTILFIPLHSLHSLSDFHAAAPVLPKNAGFTRMVRP